MLFKKSVSIYKFMKKLLLTIILLSLAKSALAEDKALGKIIVTAKKQSLSANDGDVAQDKINKIAGSAQIVKAQDLENKFVVNVKDVLDYVPGVIAQPKGGQESRLSIRGSGLSRNFHLRGLNLYQDGVPINLADGSADFQDMDALAFDHIEIFKGANALHLGSATLGGAVNFVSPTGYNSNPLTIRLEGGSFGTARSNISSGKVMGKFDYHLSWSELKSAGYRQQNQQFDSKFYSNFGYRFNDNIENRTYLTLVNSNLELPGALTRAQLNNAPKTANSANLNNKYERNFNQIRIANKTAWSYDNYSANAGVYATYKDLDHPIFQVIDQQTKNYGIFGDGKIKNNILGRENELNFGINLNSGITDSARFVNLKSSRGALTVNGDEIAKNAIGFLENNLQINKKLTFILGSQFIYAKRDYRDRFISDGNQSGVRKYYGISPKIGARYDYDKNLQFFTNLSGAYEPPTFSEARQTTASGLANISAQKSYTLEVGTRRTKSAINWDLTLYHSKLRDELILYNIGASTNQAVNANKTMHQGVEAGVDAKILSNIFSSKATSANSIAGDKLLLRLAYSFSDFRFVKDDVFANNQIPGAPRHYLRSELRYENNHGFYVAPNIEFLPYGFFIDSANKVKSPNYFLLGLNTGYEFNKNFSVFFDGRNLLDRNYTTTTDVVAVGSSNSAVYYSGNARSFYAGLKFKW